MKLLMQRTDLQQVRKVLSKMKQVLRQKHLNVLCSSQNGRQPHVALLELTLGQSLAYGADLKHTVTAFRFRVAV